MTLTTFEFGLVMGTFVLANIYRCFRGSRSEPRRPIRTLESQLMELLEPEEDGTDIPSQNGPDVPNQDGDTGTGQDGALGTGQNEVQEYEKILSDLLQELDDSGSETDTAQLRLPKREDFLANLNNLSTLCMDNLQSMDLNNTDLLANLDHLIAMSMKNLQNMQMDLNDTHLQDLIAQIMKKHE